MNPAMVGLTRPMRRKLLEDEARARRTGRWGEWEVMDFLPGTIGSKGWPAQITRAVKNNVFSVLIRNDYSGAVHLAISSLSEIRPTWHEAQRIKDEIAGEDRTAVEVYPPKAEIVDDANMYHLWVLPGSLPFSLWREA